MEKFYCQNCLALNRFGEEHCVRCGTRLMLVIEPAAARHDPSESATIHDDHILERVSALEYRLSRAVGQLEQCMDFLLRQARSAYLDHSLIETLIEALRDRGLVDSDAIQKVWRERCRRADEEQGESHRRAELKSEIIANFSGEDKSAFEVLVEEGMSCVSDANGQRVRALEQAVRLDPQNSPLNSFLGEHFFRSGKMALARQYLERAFCTSPKNDRLCLLLGLACGDEGEASRAKELLRAVVRRGCGSFAAHYALGRLLAAEERWSDALVEFKRALVARPSAETHYVVGCVYYRLNRDRMATRHLRMAVDLDGAYSAALHMLGLVYLRSGDEVRADDAFRAARSAGQDESRYRSRPRSLAQAGDDPALPPLFRAARQARKRLVTGGDKRLAEAMLEDALKVGLRRTEIGDGSPPLFAQ